MRQELTELYFQAIREMREVREKGYSAERGGMIAALKVVINLLDMLRVTPCQSHTIERAVNLLRGLSDDAKAKDHWPREVRLSLAGKRSCYDYYAEQLSEIY